MQGFVTKTRSVFRILPGGGAAGGGGGGPYMQGFVSYIPTAFRILPGEADCDAGAGAEGIGNVTSTGNSELLEVLAYQLEMETRPTPKVSKHNKFLAGELIF